MKLKILIIIGSVLMIAGFSMNVYTSTIVLAPTEPPIMRPLEGIEYFGVMYAPILLIIGITGIIITAIGTIVWRKKK